MPRSRRADHDELVALPAASITAIGLPRPRRVEMADEPAFGRLATAVRRPLNDGAPARRRLTAARPHEPRGRLSAASGRLAGGHRHAPVTGVARGRGKSIHPSVELGTHRFGIAGVDAVGGDVVAHIPAAAQE